MNCQQCVELLAQHLEQELPDDQEQDLQAHLAGCEACRKEKLILERIASQAQALPRYAPSTDCILKLGEQIHRQAPVGRRTEFGPVLDMDELAEFLRVSRETIGEYLDKIPSFELGGKLLFRRKSVEAWIESREMCRGIQGKEMLARNFETITVESASTGGVLWKL